MKLREKIAGTFFYMILLQGFLFAVSGCEKALDIKNPSPSPMAIFDEIWSTIDQRYALFGVKGIDWNAVYNQYKSQVTESMSEEALFKLSASMLETLKDGHVSLLSKSDTATYLNFYKAFPINFNYNNIVANYLKNDYATAGPLIYKVVDNTGYIYYSSFGIDVTDQQMTDVFNKLAQTKGLIIDVRNNTGGRSKNVDLLIGRFIKAKALFKYEIAKKGNGHNDFFDPVAHYVLPSTQYYINPVVVLTNRSCYSACNDFAMFMSSVSTIKLIGDQTGGGGGVPHRYLLANGWSLQFSATITLSPSKNHIENGILPSMNIAINPADELNGKDPILEKAFQLLQ